MSYWTAPLQALRRDELPGQFDPWLLLFAGTLATFGIVMVASSSIAVAEGEGLSPYYYLLRHLVFLCMGLGLAGTVALNSLDFWERNSRVLMMLSFAINPDTKEVIACQFPKPKGRKRGAKNPPRVAKMLCEESAVQ